MPNASYILLDMIKNLIANIPTNEKLDETNYDLWLLKIQFLLKDKDMIELLTTSMSAPAEKYKRGKDVSACEWCQESLKAYPGCFKRDRSAHYTILSCLYENLLREFQR